MGGRRLSQNSLVLATQNRSEKCNNKKKYNKKNQNGIIEQ